MKASKLIDELRKEITEHGDLEVVIDYDTVALLDIINVELIKRNENLGNLFLLETTDW